MTKNEKILISVAAAAGVAAVAYSLLPKEDITEDLVIHDFDKQRYLGIWNEVARLPTRIERGLSQLTENYSLNEDGSLKVITRAYNIKKDKWTGAEGRIRFEGDENVGKLQVSYFRPVYFDYNILAIDPDYQYALVSAGNLGYLWILSRTTTVTAKIRKQFLEKASSIGFDISKLEWC